MNVRYAISLAVVLLGLLISCTGSHTVDLSDFDKIIYGPEFSEGFDIRGKDGMESVIITVRNPWQGAEGVETRLFIARNGEAAPAGFDGQVLNGEAKKIVVMSSTHIAMLDAVAATDRIVGVSVLDYVNNPSILARRDRISDIGYEGNVNYEALMACEPDLVLIYGVNGASSMVDKLRELGVPYMYVGDYLEEDPLGKAEWMVALAEVVGKRDEGERVFARIPERYNALKQMVADAGEAAPKVMVNTPYADAWNIPSAKSYTARLITDAGGDFIYGRNTGNTAMPIDLEEAYRLVSEADVWLNVGMARSLDDVRGMCPKFTDTRCFVTGQVYNNNLRGNAKGGNDYFESGVVHPDVVLRDLVKIFHPDLVNDDFVYYKQLK